MSENQFQPRRYLGLELSGAKNPKTVLAVLEYYAKEKKIFLLDVHDKIGATQSLSSDEALIETIRDIQEGRSRDSLVMGVNVPLNLPPCLPCKKKHCDLPSHCTQPAVKWMREMVKKAARQYRADADLPKPREFTPYTQRPVELWIRYQVMPELPEKLRFEVDETMGGNKAPLTARMQFIKPHLGNIRMVETWPKLTVAMLAAETGIQQRLVSSHRKLEEGAYARQQILDLLCGRYGIFVYDGDARKITQSLVSFDAFLCAYTALLFDSGRCVKVPKGFPKNTGWIEYPSKLSGS